MNDKTSAFEDLYDYEHSHNKKEKFSHFLHYLCNAKEIKFVGYNDNISLANVGVDASFIFDKNSLKNLIEEYMPLAINDLNNLYANLEKNINELKLTHAMQTYISEFFPNDLFYFEMELNLDAPRFSKRGMRIITPQEGYLSYDFIPVYQEIQEIAVHIFYEIFKEWFKENIKEEQNTYIINEINRINNLNQYFMRDNVYEQELILMKMKKIFNME